MGYKINWLADTHYHWKDKLVPIKSPKTPHIHSFAQKRSYSEDKTHVKKLSIQTAS